MSVVPERMHEFFEPPKAQEGTVLPRYGVENGYLVLEDFKTRDLPRPPPPGWESAKRLGGVAAAALFVFVVVLAAAFVVRTLLPTDDDSRNYDPPLVANGTNETIAANSSAKLHIDTDVGDDVQVTGADDEGLASSTPATTRERRGTQRTLRRRAKKPTLSKQRLPLPPASARWRFPRWNSETANRGAISTPTSASRTFPTSPGLAGTRRSKDVDVDDDDDEANDGDGDNGGSSSEHDTNAQELYQERDTDALSRKAFTDILVFGPPLNESRSERDSLHGAHRDRTAFMTNSAYTIATGLAT
ncbi:uncharacterized protein LOC142587872 [Dermacentor variabilis]|uniref:uncharacterized protein LOC142587872 n=1 Tax=Dermacentor variabilis TaxID=34621 RepID=UPI003F5C6954